MLIHNFSSKELGLEKGICCKISPKLDHIRWEIWEGFKTADTDNEQRPDGGWRVNCLKAWSRISRVWEDITRIAKVSLFKNIHTGKASIIEEMLCQELPLAASRHCSAITKCSHFPFLSFYFLWFLISFSCKWNATDEGAFGPKALVCRNKMSKSRFAVIGG